MDKVRCMLAETGLEEDFWAEAASTAVYLINRTPNSVLKFKLPEEIWSGSKPDLSHLRRFGCTAYVHKVQEKTKPRALKGVFVGYPFGVKGYKVWISDIQKCETSRNVVFNEELYKDTIKKSAKDKEQSSDQTTQRAVAEADTREKPRLRKVTFAENLIQGPTPSDDESNNENGDERISDSSADVYGSEGEEDTSETYEEEQDLDHYLFARDRKRRSNIRPPSKFEDGNFVAYALVVISRSKYALVEPRNYQEARRSKDWKFWNGASVDEIDSLHRNHTWDLVERPRGQKVIGCRWLYKLKPGIPGVEDKRYKGRVVAKGYSQKEGIDYHEVFSPVVKHTSIRIMLSIVVNRDYELEQMDVKTAFLHGSLEERIFMEQPEGFIKKGDENKVCLLRKSLYGLKQSPRQWNKRFDSFMREQGFERSSRDACVYLRNVETEKAIYLLLYVDDMLIASGNKAEIKQVKECLSREFEMKDLGKASRILGMDIIRNREEGWLILSQENYLEKVLRNFKMGEARPVVTPTASHVKLRSLFKEEKLEEATFMENIPYSSAVGSLMYAMVRSRPDLGYAVGLVCRFMSSPGRDHWAAVKWILRYLKGTLKTRSTFKKHSEFGIEGFSDSDYSADLDKRRSVTGYTFKVWGNTVCWKSNLQSVVALSTTEAEYMALSEAAKEALWLKGLCAELGLGDKSVLLHCDSQIALALAKNDVHHEKTKHVDTKFHHIRDTVSKGQITLAKIHTTKNPADFLTKALPGPKFELCCDILGVV